MKYIENNGQRLPLTVLEKPTPVQGNWTLAITSNNSQGSPICHRHITDWSPTRHRLITDSSHDIGSSPIHERLITGTREANHRYSTIGSLLIYHRSPTHRRLITDTWQAKYCYITESSPIHTVHHRLITETPRTHLDYKEKLQTHHTDITITSTWHTHHRIPRAHHRHITDTSQMQKRRLT
jgi:hypothetical protein